MRSGCTGTKLLSELHSAVEFVCQYIKQPDFTQGTVCSAICSTVCSAICSAICSTVCSAICSAVCSAIYVHHTCATYSTTYIQYILCR